MMAIYRSGLIAIFVTLLLAACSQQPANESLEVQANSWKPLGGALDVVAKNNVSSPKALLDRNGKLVVVWAEDSGLWYLQAKRWNGTIWEKLSFLSKALPYNNYGVNAFDAAFDGSNTLVVSQRATSGVVTVYKAGSSWTPLGSFDGLVQLQTNSSGQIHTIAQTKTTGNNIVRRWTGSSWQALNRNWQRDTTKVALPASLFTQNGNIYIVWQEAACEQSASCGGTNLYVSQYVP
jgi:hypothetical protein